MMFLGFLIAVHIYRHNYKYVWKSVSVLGGCNGNLGVRLVLLSFCLCWLDFIGFPFSYMKSLNARVFSLRFQDLGSRPWVSRSGLVHAALDV